MTTLYKFLSLFQAHNACLQNISAMLITYVSNTFEENTLVRYVPFTFQEISMFFFHKRDCNLNQIANDNHKKKLETTI